MLASLLVLVLAGAPANFPHEYAQTKGFTRGLPQNVRIAPDGAVFYLKSGSRSSKLALYQRDSSSGKGVELVTPAQLLGGAIEPTSAPRTTTATSSTR